MDSSFNNTIFVESYCILAGFFALPAEEQRALIPSRCEPIYAAFNEGDGTFTRPLDILFHNFRDDAVRFTYHHDEREYSFIAESLNDALLENIGAIYDAQWNAKDFFDTARLEEPLWNALREASRAVWNTLDDAHRLPFGNWRDYAG